MKTDDEQLTCELAKLPFPYFWVLEVRTDAVYIRVRKRLFWWPFRFGQIADRAGDYVGFSDGVITQARLNELAERSVKLAENFDPVKDMRKQLRRVRFSQPVRITK